MRESFEIFWKNFSCRPIVRELLKFLITMLDSIAYPTIASMRLRTASSICTQWQGFHEGGIVCCSVGCCGVFVDLTSLGVATLSEGHKGRRGRYQGIVNWHSLLRQSQELRSELLERLDMQPWNGRQGYCMSAYVEVVFRLKIWMTHSKWTGIEGDWLATCATCAFQGCVGFPSGPQKSISVSSSRSLPLYCCCAWPEMHLLTLSGD